MAEPQEAALLAAARRGDTAAFGRLVHTHQSALRLSIRQWTGADAALADDLAQETFLRAWRKLALFDGRARFASWLYRIPYNLWLNQRQRPQPVFTEPLPEPANQDDFSERDLERALQRLPESQRLAIHLCLQRDFTHAEAADILGIPLGTVKSLVLRGRQQLQLSMADYAPPKEDYAHG